MCWRFALYKCFIIIIIIIIIIITLISVWIWVNCCHFTHAFPCLLLFFQDEIDPALLAMLQQQQARKERKPKKLTPEQADAKRRKIWISIAKKEIPKVDFEQVLDIDAWLCISDLFKALSVCAFGNV